MSGLRPRVLVALFRQETNSFVPGVTTLADFERDGMRSGADVLRRVGNAEVDGYLDAAEREGIDLVPLLAARAQSGPPVDAAAFEDIAGRICAGVQREAAGVDGILLGLHGAMVTTSHDDAEGELLRRVRAIVGPEMPLAVTFDLHAHMTDAIAGLTSILVGYQTCPHVDLRRTGDRAMTILAAALRGEVEPVLTHRKIRMMTSSETHDDRLFPNREVIGALHEAETRPGILAAMAFCTQPWLDVPELGWSIVVVTDGDPGVGRDVADEIAQRAWSLRDHYAVEKVPVGEAIDLALAGDGLFALSDGADSTTAGGLGDGNLLLRALLDRAVPVPSLVMVRDGEAAAACAAAGVGATVTVGVGGSANPAFYDAVQVTGTVRNVTDGRYTAHYGGVRAVNMGLTAVLQAGQGLDHDSDRSSSHGGPRGVPQCRYGADRHADHRAEVGRRLPGVLRADRHVHRSRRARTIGERPDRTPVPPHRATAVALGRRPRTALGVDPGRERLRDGAHPARRRSCRRGPR